MGSQRARHDRARAHRCFTTLCRVSAVRKAVFLSKRSVRSGAQPVNCAVIQDCRACPPSTGPARSLRGLPGGPEPGTQATAEVCAHERVSTCGPVPLHLPHGPPSTLRFNMLLRIVYFGESESHLVVSDSLWPHRLQPARLLRPWDSPGKNTRVGCHALLQGIFPTQGSNPGLLHYRRILDCLSHQEFETFGGKLWV